MRRVSHFNLRLNESTVSIPWMTFKFIEARVEAAFTFNIHALFILRLLLNLLLLLLLILVVAAIHRRTNAHSLQVIPLVSSIKMGLLLTAC